MKREILIAIGIVILFLVVGIQPAMAITQNRPIPLSQGNTLYVGGSGPSNYTRIQDAIDNASNGDTIFVYDDSSPYYENVVINKIINLTGQNKYTTVIDGIGSKYKNTVAIEENNVKLSGFTIQNATRSDTFGIFVNKGNNTIITNNIITNNGDGISINPDYGYKSYRNLISNNIIQNNSEVGLSISCYDSVISNNIIFNNYNGIEVWIADNNLIKNNDIKDNHCGIALIGANVNEISHNNIYQNKRNSWYVLSDDNEWNSNYWGRFKVLPKIILGIKLKYLFKIEIGPEGSYMNIFLPLPIFDFDKNPVGKPYDIEVKT